MTLYWAIGLRGCARLVRGLIVSLTAGMLSLAFRSKLQDAANVGAKIELAGGVTVKRLLGSNKRTPECNATVGQAWDMFTLRL